MMKLVFIVGYGGYSAPLLEDVLKELKSTYNFEYSVYTDQILGKDHAKEIAKADAVFVYTHRLTPEIEEALKEHEGVVLNIHPDFTHLSKAPPEAVEMAVLFYKLGGRENLKSVTLLMLKLCGLKVNVPKPKEVPWHGIYHPRFGTFTSIKEYFKAYDYRHRKLVGVLFYRSEWLYGNTVLVDLLVNALESRGLGVIPVFTYSFKDLNIGSPSADDSIREFFFENGKPLIDVLLNLTSFFLLDRKEKTRPAGFKAANGIELLKRLNVPIIQAVKSYYRSREEWLENSLGIDYMGQVYGVIMPEVDGLIQPVLIAGSKVSADGIKRYEPVEEHIDYLARIVSRWIRLRDKPLSERKIAIVLINPPCKGLEANIAVGMGLDVPESVVKLLWKLKELGYNVGEHLPKNGDELVKIIMEKKAISEFRWTPVEEIVAKGGAAGFVNEKQYIEWFNELPAESRKRMMEEWGDPTSVLEGKAPRELAGMVYEGKFVVPGIFFGNVFITPQPKRGCAGAKCDGKVCRILHDPTIPPPHQWLAVYRWITRVFKADVVIHFGTHGYLEFLPGKGVGLSWLCWPEISIDDVPHLYVYVVANPMEGVVAKRRGYAALVDHLYPPMKMAHVLDELDSLLTQYSKAKTLGDEARTRIIFEQLIKKAREFNVPVKDGEDMDHVVEDIHRYVDLVRGSQINIGLHVLGMPPKNRKLAEYVVTAMAYDSHSCPSIRRVLAEYLGLDYDELKRNPLEYNAKLGLVNKDILSRLDDVAVYVIEKLLEQEEVSDAEILKVVEEGLLKCLA